MLQATALVNEAYLRLIDWKNVQWQNRAHFFGVAAQTDAAHPGRRRPHAPLPEAGRRRTSGVVLGSRRGLAEGRAPSWWRSTTR